MSRACGCARFLRCSAAPLEARLGQWDSYRMEGITSGWKSTWVWSGLGVCKDPSHFDKGIFGFLGNLISHFYHGSLFWATYSENPCCRVQGVQLNFTLCSFLQMSLGASSSFLKSSVGSDSQYWSSLRCSSCFLEVFLLLFLTVQQIQHRFVKHCMSQGFRASLPQSRVRSNSCFGGRECDCIIPWALIATRVIFAWT